MTYDNAKDNCAEKIFNGGKLFEPATWDENKLVTTAFNDVHWSGGCWIGVNDMNQENKFISESSGQEVAFTWWSPGQPDNSNDEDCVEIWFDEVAVQHVYPACTVRPFLRAEFLEFRLVAR